MATITKRDLAIRITENLRAQNLEIPQQDALEIIQCLIQEITTCLTEGHNVVMRNFGAFQVRQMKEKVGRNPKNPDVDVVIPARAAVKFKPGKEMKEKVSLAQSPTLEKPKTKIAAKKTTAKKTTVKKTTAKKAAKKAAAKSKA